MLSVRCGKEPKHSIPYEPQKRLFKIFVNIKKGKDTMKKILRYGLIAIAILLGIYILGALFIPTTWSVTETITIKAPAEKVYEQIANLKNWQNWSPWNKEMDPTQVYTYEGPESGKGAKWLWTGEKMGKGWLEITDASVEKGIDYKLFIDMKDHQSLIDGAMHYTHSEDGLNVVWTDSGDVGNSFNYRWMTLFIKMMLGKEMNKGLEKLKFITEQH